MQSFTKIKVPIKTISTQNVFTNARNKRGFFFFLYSAFQFLETKIHFFFCWNAEACCGLVNNKKTTFRDGRQVHRSDLHWQGRIHHWDPMLYCMQFWKMVLTSQKTVLRSDWPIHVDYAVVFFLQIPWCVTFNRHVLNRIPFHIQEYCIILIIGGVISIVFWLKWYLFIHGKKDNLKNIGLCLRHTNSRDNSR